MRFREFNPTPVDRNLTLIPRVKPQGRTAILLPLAALAAQVPCNAALLFIEVVIFRTTTLPERSVEWIQPW